MKGLIKTIKQIWAVEELRNRIGYTLLLILYSNNVKNAYSIVFFQKLNQPEASYSIPVETKP